MAIIKIGKSGGAFTGTTGSDTYQFTAVPTAAVTIDGLTSGKDNSGATASVTRWVAVDDDDPSLRAAYSYNTTTGATVNGGATSDAATTLQNALLTPTDARLTLAFRPSVVATTATGTDTNRTTVSGYNAQDVVVFSKSGDYSSLGDFFTNIETIRLASGVKVTLDFDALAAAKAYASRGALNYGITLEGVAGGATETVTFKVNFEAGDIVAPPVGAGYVIRDCQLDDFAFAGLASNVELVFDARDPADDDDNETNADGFLQTSFGRYFRFDGTNNGEKVLGTDGVDYATLRLGNDTAFGFAGNDRLVGHGGADSLDGGDGDDLFEIGSFGTGTSGTSSKADDGKAEWIISSALAASKGVTNGITNATDYANKTDVIVGGAGYDTLRVTTGIGATTAANGTIALDDNNFKQMEKVEVGGAISRDPDESAFQQLRDGHLLFARNSSVSDLATAAGGASGNSINNVVIDASGVTKNGLTFEGNANTQKFIGTTKADVFIGNGGSDTLTGGAGADKFVFQTIREYARDSSTANGVIAYAPVDAPFAAAASDVITDFTTGSDKIVFRVEATTTLEDSFKSLVALTKGNLTADNVLIGDLTSIDTAGTATQFIKADTTGADVKVYYDADGSGVGAAILIATLTNVATVGVADFRVEAVQGF